MPVTTGEAVFMIPVLEAVFKALRNQDATPLE